MRRDLGGQFGAWRSSFCGHGVAAGSCRIKTGFTSSQETRPCESFPVLALILLLPAIGLAQPGVRLTPDAQPSSLRVQITLDPQRLPEPDRALSAGSDAGDRRGALLWPSALSIVSILARCSARSLAVLARQGARPRERIGDPGTLIASKSPFLRTRSMRSRRFRGYRRSGLRWSHLRRVISTAGASSRSARRRQISRGHHGSRHHRRDHRRRLQLSEQDDQLLLRTTTASRDALHPGHRAPSIPVANHQYRVLRAGTSTDSISPTVRPRRSTDGEHGTACAEVVYEVAPGVNFLLLGFQPQLLGTAVRGRRHTGPDPVRHPEGGRPRAPR